MVFEPKCPFLELFFYFKIGQENVFYDILDRKNGFLGYKNKKFKKSRNCRFSKGVTQWFWSKNGRFFFYFFVCGQYRLGKCVLRYSRMKNAFVGYKKGGSKSRKIAIFGNGKKREPMVLVQKQPFYQLLFLRQNRAVKCLLGYSGTKKRISRV